MPNRTEVASESPVNSHRETTVTAPVLDSTSLSPSRGVPIGCRLSLAVSPVSSFMPV